MQINSINISELQSELDKWGGQACADNGSRLITHDDRTIRLYLKQSQQMEYASYAPNTYYLMASPNYCSYSYDYKAGRTKVELMPYYNAGTRQKHNVGTLLLQWYKHGGNIDEFVQMFPQIAEELRANKQTTDHVNSDIHNHCIWNLSQMTSIDNLHKTDYVARIKPPYYCYPIITADNKYRIRFGYETPFGQGQEMHIKCETSELFLAFLRSIMSMDRAAAWMRKYGTPKQVYSASGRKSFFAAQDFVKADKYVQQLLTMDESEFIDWTADTQMVIRNYL